MRFPSNVPGAIGHHWTSGIAMATPVAHKGATQGAKAYAMTIIDLLTRPDLLTAAKDYFDNVQQAPKSTSRSCARTTSRPIWLNKDTMDRFKPELKKFYYDPTNNKTYLEQLGIAIRRRCRRRAPTFSTRSAVALESRLEHGRRNGDRQEAPMLIARNGLACLAALLFAATLQAQSTTGTISGRVTDPKLCAPGATVTLTSPALQGSRTTVTAENGDYILPPPGVYKVSVELSGFETLEENGLISRRRRRCRGRPGSGPAALQETVQCRRDQAANVLGSVHHRSRPWISSRT